MVPLTVGMWISSVGGSLVVPLMVDMSFSSTARSSVGIVSLLVPWLGVSDLIHQMGLVMASCFGKFFDGPIDEGHGLQQSGGI